MGKLEGGVVGRVKSRKAGRHPDIVIRWASNTLWYKQQMSRLQRAGPVPSSTVTSLPGFLFTNLFPG